MVGWSHTRYFPLNVFSFPHSLGKKKNVIMGFCCIWPNIGFIEMHHVSLTGWSVVGAGRAHSSKLKTGIVYPRVWKAGSHTSEAGAKWHWGERPLVVSMKPHDHHASFLHLEAWVKLLYLSLLLLSLSFLAFSTCNYIILGGMPSEFQVPAKTSLNDTFYEHPWVYS